MTLRLELGPDPGAAHLVLEWMKGEVDGVEWQLDTSAHAPVLVLTVVRGRRRERHAIDLKPMIDQALEK